MTPGNETGKLLPETVQLLADSAGELSTVARDLYKSAVLSRLQRTLISVGIVLILILSMIVAVQVFAIRGNSQINRDNGIILKDCAQPGGRCYEESLRRQITASELLIVTAVCARQFEVESQIRACIKERERK